jgi:hypothetical protein
MPLTRFHGQALGLALVTLLAAGPVAAQTLGARAAGLAEAFVAVADDATSVYWNPAGMATGSYLSLVLDFGAGELDQGAGGAPGAGRSGTRFIGATMPALGLAYYRQSRLVAPAPAGSAGSSRQDGRQSVQGLAISTAGATVAQSVTDYLVVAGTVKLLRGSVSGGVVDAGDPGAALDRADDLTDVGTTRFDVDAGAMVTVGRWRAGLAARNLSAPSFDAPADGEPLRVDREVRAGVAWGAGWPGTSRLVLAADADVTRRVTGSGDRRDVAAGVETWWLNQRLGVRGGVRGSLEGEVRPIVAAGLSAALANGVFVEAHVAAGRRDERTWSVGARVTY